MPRVKVTKTGLRLIYLGIAAYLVFLFHALPASFLTRFILPAIPATRGVSLQGVHGTIWQGQATDARIANFNLGKLQWALRSWGLLLGKLKLHLNFSQDNLRGNAYVSIGMGGTLSADDVDVQFPAESLMPLLYGYPLSIAGDLRGNLKEVTLKHGRVLQVQGRIVWKNAALRAPQNIDMGDYLITLEPINLGSKIVIKDQGQGPVLTEITIIVNGAGEYKMNGWLKARDATQQSVTEGLRMLGRPDNSGRYWVGYNGKLRDWQK
jgi:general secretion pathway protein N